MKRFFGGEISFVSREEREEIRLDLQAPGPEVDLVGEDQGGEEGPGDGEGFQGFPSPRPSPPSGEREI